jgi:hypothetical protein
VVGRRCLARVQQVGGRPTIEGIIVQRRPHYVLERPRMIEDEERSIDLDGRVEVLREHIAFVQLIAKAA